VNGRDNRRALRMNNGRLCHIRPLSSKRRPGSVARFMNVPESQLSGNDIHLFTRTVSAQVRASSCGGIGGAKRMETAAMQVAAA
jgi:hypothetical protein